MDEIILMGNVKRVLTAEDFPEVRSLTRRERKELLKSGLAPSAIGVKAQGENVNQVEVIQLTEDMLDYVLAKGYPGYDFEDAPNALCFKLAQDTIQRTLGMKEHEAKNS